MTSLQECKDIIRAYIENSGFEVTDENALDDAARELRDICSADCTDHEIPEYSDFIAVIAKYDI